MKFTYHYSPNKKPLVAIGANQSRMLEFATSYPGWHSLGRDKATKEAARGLERRGSIVVNEFNQFKANL